MTKTTVKKILLNNVRLSFPSIFTREVFEGKEGKYAATFLLDKKDVATKEKIDAAITSALAEAKVKVESHKYCIKDGDITFDEKEYDGYQGTWGIKASSSKRPTVINRDKSPITVEDDILYAGCYVNAVIDIWIQNNGYGKRVNANLYGVQFLKDGDSFGTGPSDVTEDFDDLDL
tara:strand:+ start:485 stop:1009 length:525 start_codon:yes stop_codon:yes gene_type:complete